MPPKILFVHNTMMWYRKPFFKKISQIFDMNLVFTNMESSKEIYGVNAQDTIKGLEGVNYKILKNYFGIAFPIFKESFGNYDVMVGGNWDTSQDIIETIIYFSICKIRGKKFVLWRENWHYWMENMSIKKRTILPLIKYIVKKSDAILVPGIIHKEFFISLGSDPSKIFFLPNVSSLKPLENSYKKADELKRDYNIHEKKILLYVGRLVKRKGVDYLLHALSKIIKNRRDVALLIVGTGECEDQLKKLSKELKIAENTFFVGYVDNKELASYYIACDICIIPSINYKMADPAPLVVNEAMSFGNPVIATDAVGCSFDLIENGENGFIVPEKDVNALYDAMNVILSDPSLALEMGKKSIEIVRKKFKYENMVTGFKKAINYSLGIYAENNIYI